MLNSQGSLSCSPWQSVCRDWTATDGTHNCMAGCESTLAVTASWLICVCGIRWWNPHVWWFLEMNLLQRCWVERVGRIAWCGRSCDFTPVDICWSNDTEHICIPPFCVPLMEGHTEIEQVLRPAVIWDCDICFIFFLAVAYSLGSCVDSKSIHMCRTHNILHFRMACSF